MKSTHFLFAFAALFGAYSLPSQAQPELPRPLQPRVKEAAPEIEPEAQKLMDAMVARYAALNSYSDITQSRLEEGAGLPQQLADALSFEAILQWQRPHNVRFEGKNSKGAFLALGNAQKLRVVSTQHRGNYVSRERNPPLIMTAADGTKTTLPANATSIQFDAPLMEVDVTALGSAFMLEPEFWKRTQQDLRILALDPDTEASPKTDGEACSVVRMQLAFDDGGSAMWRLYLAKSDGLLRRIEHTDARMGMRVVETHAKLRLNPELPASTWDFAAPADAKPIEYFSQLEPRRFDPDLKIGDLLPTFAGDDLGGQPLELNSKSGKEMVIYFSNMAQAAHDLQILKKMHKVIGHDHLQIVFVSGDGARERLEKFVEHLKLPFPTYFDESGTRNPLAQKFGVKGWATTFLFGRDGRLKTICSRPSEADFQKSLQALLPGTPDDAFILQDGDFIPAP